MRTLDEIPSEELITELVNRHNRRTQLKCPYCSQPLKRKDGSIPTDWKEGGLICSCRFSTEDYHSAFALNRIQYQ